MIEFLLCVLIVGQLLIWLDVNKDRHSDSSWPAGPFIFLIILFGTILYLFLIFVTWLAEIAWEALKGLF